MERHGDADEANNSVSKETELYFRAEMGKRSALLLSKVQCFGCKKIAFQPYTCITCDSASCGPCSLMDRQNGANGNPSGSAKRTCTKCNRPLTNTVNIKL